MNSGDEARRRFEFRCPDSSCNPYLAMSAIVMAMIDGIQSRTSPGKPLDKDLYDLEPEEQRNVARTPTALHNALDSLERDHEFLLRGDVFTPDLINNWLHHKRQDEVEAVRQRPHPLRIRSLLRLLNHAFCHWYDAPLRVTISESISARCSRRDPSGSHFTDIHKPPANNTERITCDTFFAWLCLPD